MPLSFESPRILAIALALAAATAGAALWRRPSLPRLTAAFTAIGLILLSFAAAGLAWRRAGAGEVLVLVDVSPSTRTAAYRDRAALQRRIQELLGNTPHRTMLFAEDLRPDAGAAAPTLDDIAAERTVFAPPPAGAILLFSDARFDLPVTAARTFIAVDPALDEVNDAAVTRLEVRGADLATDVAVSGPPRRLMLEGTTATTRPLRIEPGRLTIARPLKPGIPSASAQFSPGDAWPENDALWIHPPPPPQAQRWWVGDRPPPPGDWRAFTPAALPADAPAYLAPSIIVLDGVPAAALPTAPLLMQYVRDLGGSLLILGGEHAFAAGDYAASPLEALSPLASYPPRPAMQWILLVDGSGSMAEQTPDGTRWQLATSAVTRLLPHLPPDDLVTLGSFAETITWWTTGTSVRDTASLSLPPANIAPRGPTNLRRALADIASSAAAGDTPRQLIILTDAEAQIDDPAALAAALSARHISLHVLAIGPADTASGLPALRQIAAATGGSVRPAADLRSWAESLLDLTRAAMPDRIERSPLPLRFGPPLTLPARRVTPWNRTWLKSGATPLADARGNDTEAIHPAARWHVGSGEVVAAAFAATPDEAAALADLIAQPPRDPRYRITWDAGPTLHVSIDATDGKAYLNHQPLALELRDAEAPGAAARTQPIPQTGPGRYDISLAAPRVPTFAAVLLGGSRALDRTALAARYAPEFDAIGNDHDAMRELARRSGGEVIPPSQSRPIDFHWPRRDVPLTMWLALAGAAFLAAALAWWRVA